MFRNRAIAFLVLCSCIACGDDDSNSSNNTSTNNDTDASNNSTAGSTNNTAGTDNQTDPQIEIIGTYNTNFDTVETITATTWNFGVVTTIEHYDNTDNFAVLLNPPDAQFSPNKYSRVEWTEPDAQGFYYCTVDFDLDTLQDALDSTETADSSDLDGQGCGGFAWTKMTPQ